MPAERAGEGGVQPLAGSAAIAIGQDLCAFKDLRLLAVVGRHGYLARLEARLQRGEHTCVGMQFQAERGGDALAGEVVLGRPQASRQHDDVRTVQRDADGVRKALAVVADDGLEGDRDAELVQAGGKGERVGVLTVGCQHLRTYGDDLSNH